METPEKERVPKGPNKLAKGEGSVYQRASDGRWLGTLTLPSHDGKTRRRKTVTAKTEKEALAKLRALRKERNAVGDLPTKTQTFGSWANIWYDQIASKKVRPKTAATYRTYLTQYILPVLNDVQLTKLTPAHVRRVHDYILAKGLSSTTAVQAHRIVAVCLKYAERDGRVPRNVANLTDAPQKAYTTLTVITAADARKIIETSRDDRLGSRWAAALHTGARQGELLGLELDRVGDKLDLSWQLQRLAWEHGCEGKCGKRFATYCPDKKLTTPPGWEHRHLTGGLYLSRPKTRKSNRRVLLVEPLRSMIESRVLAAQREPNPHGLLWTADAKWAKNNSVLLPLDGAPIDPSIDNRAWHELLKRAGVPDARLHDARHTAASLLLKAGTSEPVIMKLLGHSSYVTTRGYQDVDDEQEALALMRASDLLK